MTPLAEVAPGVLVATADLYTTTSTVVAGPDGNCLVIDPAVTPADLAALAAGIAARGLRAQAAWSTHPHWDHVLWSRDLGDVPRYATPRAVAFAHTERARLIDATEAEAPGHDADLIGRLVALEAEAIPWDGPAALVVAHDGHAPGHGAVFLPGTGTLIAGDMCSDIEIPLLDLDSPDPAGAYRAGLERLAALPGVRRVIPGHGRPAGAAGFARRIAADRAYLDALERGAPVRDPRLTRDWLRAEHDKQRTRCTPG